MDDQDEFVDQGPYKFVDDERTIEFGKSPGFLVQFSFGDDRNPVTFDVAIPDMNIGL